MIDFIRRRGQKAYRGLNIACVPDAGLAAGAASVRHAGLDLLIDDSLQLNWVLDYVPSLSGWRNDLGGKQP